MADTLKLEIVTPESKIYSEDVEMVTLPGSEGEAGIYPNHVPLMTQVQAGEIVVSRDGNEEIVAIGEGFAEVTGEHVAILTDNAANSGDIDEAAAEQAKAKAEQRLQEGGDISEDEARALNQAVLYSQAQIKAKRRKRG
ncbi:MAG: ATP synthase F1 subunit epsilon [Verrucomicrobiales bacterium]|jgi:F-type H+-transporting ATPase subunit epsilon|nr:ATP synthase F1 subunit epsilon [Verrucomicrobiales bacterium]MEC7811212.1 ATP synthase F1 subunit epsilon [Verrucomicrobiota bacterium]|tara:strand:- start:420 stop:836 length:417 start_codon:yes stop_codon:yes gene_type:complete